jgi:hypothetical protein
VEARECTGGASGSRCASCVPGNGGAGTAKRWGHKTPKDLNLGLTAAGENVHELTVSAQHAPVLQPILAHGTMLLCWGMMTLAMMRSNQLCLCSPFLPKSFQCHIHFCLFFLWCGVFFLGPEKKKHLHHQSNGHCRLLFCSSSFEEGHVSGTVHRKGTNYL